MVKIIIAPFNKPGELHLFIKRKYLKKGTNGKLYINGTLHSECIELPWKDNKHQTSCIPEGCYTITKRHSARLGDHLHVMDVPNRDLILIHPANNALLELKGCIAPVTTITGEGCGSESRKAFKPLLEKVYAALYKGEKVRLSIFSNRTVRNEQTLMKFLQQVNS